MGDKSPKSMARVKKQDTVRKAGEKAAHDKKQTPATEVAKGKGK